MEWSAYVIDVALPYREDSDRVVEIMRQIAGEMRKDTDYARVMIEPIEIFGIDNFTDTGVIIKARFKTQPAQQYSVGREYRRRLKKALDSEGIGLGTTARPPVDKSAAPGAPA